MHKQVAYLHDCELLNPVAGRPSAHLCGDFMKVLGCDAKLLGIVGDGPVLAVTAAFKHTDEARHDVGNPLRGFFSLEKSGMGTHRVEVEGTHSLQDSLLAIGLGGVLLAEGNITEVVFHNGKRLSLQLEDGMHEEVQPSARPVAAVRHTGGLLLGGQEELVELAVVRGLDAAHVTGHYNHATACHQRVFVAGELNPTGSGCAKEVQNLLLHRSEALGVSSFSVDKSTKILADAQAKPREKRQRPVEPRKTTPVKLADFAREVGRFST